MGAEVYWNGTQIGVSTDDNGTFTLKRTENSNTLVISYIGYKTKTVKVTNSEALHIQLEPQIGFGRSSCNPKKELIL